MTTAPWTALAAPFLKSEVKTRPQGRMTLSYVTARTVMNRLDDVLGPENWWDEYVPLEHSVVCRLTIRLADGSTVTKTDAGGMAGMTDQGDDDKSGFSDAFKRAAVKFGIGRYLYGDGVPVFARGPTEDEIIDQVAARNGNGATPKPPRNGGWLYRMACKRGAVDWFNEYGRKRGLPHKIVDWSDGMVTAALDARRAYNRANGRQEAHS